MATRVWREVPGWWLPVAWLGTALAYFLSGALALLFTHGQAGASLLWLPAGLMLATLLLFGYRLWPGIFLGAVVLATVAGSPLGEILGRAAGATVEALLAAWLIGSLLPFPRISDVLRFIAAILIAALPAAMIAGLSLGMVRYGEVVANGWLSDVAGMLVVTPLVLAWTKCDCRLLQGRGWELLLFLLLAVALSVLVFSDWIVAGDLVFLLLALFLWASLRLGAKGTMALTLLVSLIAAFFTVHGQGPFLAPSPWITQLTVQGFAMVAAIGGLIMVAAMQERAAALDELRLSDRIINATPEHISILDRNHVYRRVNHTYEVAHGKPMREIVGQHPADLLGDDLYAQLIKPNLDRCFAGQEVHYGAWFNFNGMGRRYMMVTYLPLPDGEGHIDNVAVLARDVTEIKEVEEKLELAGKVIENTPEGVLITDAQMRILAVNPAFSSTTGYSAEEIIGLNPRILSSGRHDLAFYRAMWEDLERAGQWQGEVWNRRKNGEIYPEWLNITVIRGPDGRASHYAGIFSDISTQEHVRKRLHSLAYYDALTELPNRELFQDRLRNAIAQGRREGRQVALMFLDLDRFKNINDSLGHAIGDDLLKQVAALLKECVRESDTVARLGGDEFTVTLSGVSHSDDAAQVARKIIAAFSQPMLVGGRELFVTTSIGIALFPADGHDADTLIKSADTAMYRAKELGRNNYQFFESAMSARFSERLALETDLRHALEKGELALAYQAQLSLEDGRIIGYEALARWNHPRQGPIGPDIFIPIAEETGLIVPLGEWVLHSALAQARAWSDELQKPLAVSVNLSAYQLRQEGFVESVRTLLERYCNEHCRLELELTETLLMENLASAAAVLAKLSALGVNIAVDDFGTGYSSLGYLKQLPIDRLKIDRTFIDDIPHDSNDVAITSAIIALGKALDLRVIAEGVEKVEQLEFLRTHGCDEAQGYFFSRPVSAEEMGQQLRVGHLPPHGQG